MHAQRHSMPLGPSPLMIHFAGAPGSRPRGMGRWGGRALYISDLSRTDLALRLGAPRPWIESLIQEVLRQPSRQVVLVDPDFRLFMGDARENRERFLQALEECGVGLIEINTGLPLRPRMRQTA
ncbi:MAG: hypothetical protein KDC10_16695 [Calditrichaeota bacterium]|nr:hypothetical protein [Candidatus Cloacimonadota bacterium]MCB1048832.1 hypothetical protein [Calditrichota bacterium]